MILDVGCGRHKRGDVGVDRLPLPSVDYVVDVDKEPLPFPDNSFSTVLSHHLVEHLENPEWAIREMLRVCNGQLKITVPHRYGKYAKHSTFGGVHRQFLNKRWFLQLGRKLRVETYVRTIFLPVFYLGPVGLLLRPHELVVEMRK